MIVPLEANTVSVLSQYDVIVTTPEAPDGHSGSASREKLNSNVLSNSLPERLRHEVQLGDHGAREQKQDTKNMHVMRAIPAMDVAVTKNCLRTSAYRKTKAMQPTKRWGCLVVVILN